MKKLSTEIYRKKEVTIFHTLFTLHSLICVIKMRYFVIVYVGHFWSPTFGPISVRSLIYTPKSLFFTRISFLCMP